MPSDNYRPVDQAWQDWHRQTGTYYNTSDRAWYGWVTVSNSTTITPSQYITANQAWDIWTDQTATGATTYYPTYATQVWHKWVDVHNPNHWTDEQIAEQNRRNLEAACRRDAERKATQERRVAARTRARLLLDSFLTDEQKTELDTHGRFHVTGSRGRRYCIRAAGQSGNVELLKPDGSMQARLCAHPTYTHDRPGELVPEGDAWLAQMLEITTDEDNFLAKANVHAGHLPPDAPRRATGVLLR